MPPILASFGASSIKSFGLTAFRGVQALVTSLFNFTSLLLNTSSTNGAQNNTILDSSGNNFTITRNGNLTQGTFTPFSQPPGYWSNYFDGTTSTYLSFPSNTVFAFGTGAYTVEGWIYQNERSTNEALFFGSGGGSGAFLAYVKNNGAVSIENFGGGAVVTGSAGDVPLNTWCHIAYVRSSTASNDTKIYVNGVLKVTGTDATNWTVSDQPRIGMLTANVDYAVKGYMSNVRIIKGGAIYAGGFIPSTVPLTTSVSSGTVSLLTCQSNRFVDNSINAFTLTPTGTTSVQAFSPFAPTDEYSVAAVGGSAYFDGTADSLNFQDTTQSGTSSDFNIGASNNASVDYWFYLQQASYAAGFNKQVAVPSDWSGQIWYQNNLYDSGNISVFWRGGNNYNYYYTALPSAYINQWNHFVFASDTSNNLSVFLNGTRILTTVTTIGLATTTNFITWGQQAAGQTQGAFKGYMSGLRFIQGSGAFNAASSTITVPTAPPTNTATTKLLLNMTNAGIYDATAKNDIETLGNAQVSTTQAKWGTTSIYFDGSGDYLYTVNPCVPNTGDFTLEMWIYPTSTAGYQIIYSQYTYGSSGGNFELLWDEFNEKFNVNFRGSTVLTSSSTFSLNTWHHLAIERYGSAITMYVNGNSQATVTNSQSILQTASYIGTRSLLDGFFSGYIDDLRITRGYAVYKSNFNPPTAAFPLK